MIGYSCNHLQLQGFSDVRRARLRKAGEDTNRALELQQRQQGAIPQNQFEVNQLRGQLQQQQMFQPGPAGRCVQGAVSC